MLRNSTRIFVTGLLFVGVVYGVAKVKEPTENRYLPRQIVTTESISFDPLFFATEAKTLNPVDIVREAREGYLTKMCEPWGMLLELQPTYRFWFNNEALPYAELRQHDCGYLALRQVDTHVPSPETGYRKITARIIQGTSRPEKKKR